MFFIPGFLISLATFPGVIVHEFAHLVFCKLTGTPVVRVCFFRLGNPAGYVIHQQPRSVWRHILIGIGPFFVNTLIALAMGIAALPMHIDSNHLTPASGFILWLAISIGMHSFPSTGDAKAIWNSVWSAGAPFTARILGSPLVAVIFLGAIGSFFWLDAVYGAALVLAVPPVLPKTWNQAFVRIPDLHLDTRTGTTPAVAGTTPAATAATNSKAAQLRAIQLYPDLARAHSKLNDEFVRRYQQYKRINPGYFDNPEWPTRLAHESQSALLGY